MKKLPLFLAFIFAVTLFTNAQGDASKKFRFGLRIAPEPAWLRSNDKKKIDPTGAVFGFGFGLNMEFRLTDVVNFSTGIGGDFEGGKQDFLDSTYYTVDKDDVIQKFEDVDSLTNTSYSTYMLQSRKLKTTALTIPLTLKLMTKEIGGMKYFGQFGVNVGYLLKMRATDQVKTVYKKGVYQSYKEEELTDVNPYVGTIPIRMGLNVGFGAEYRLSGSTSAFASINYVHQFFNSFVQQSKYYANEFTTTTPIKLTDKAKQSALGTALQINLGILF
jgi:hypothetical protein